MNSIAAIAKNTFKETIRDKVLYGILAFALLFLMSTIMFGSVSLGEDVKVIKDLGLAGIYLFSIIICIFVGASLIHKEIEKQTLYIIFSKPVSPSHFVLGKFLGLTASMLILLTLMTVVYLAIIGVKDGGFDYLALWSSLLLFFELLIFIALAIFFSSFSTPLATTIYSIIILYCGHSISLLYKETDKISGILKLLGQAAYYLLPNLEKFNIRNSIVHNITPTPSQIIWPICYSIFYSAILIYLATTLIKKRDL